MILEFDTCAGAAPTDNRPIVTVGCVETFLFVVVPITVDCCGCEDTAAILAPEVKTVA